MSFLGIHPSLADEPTFRIESSPTSVGTFGSTTELGYFAVEHPHYVTNFHATVLHQLGLDPLALEVPSRRLEIDLGKPIQEIIA